MKKSGHPYYQFYDDLNSYQKKCKDQDEQGHQLIFGDDDCDDSDSEDECMETEKEADIDAEVDEQSKDTIRRHQFDHNKNIQYMTR